MKKSIFGIAITTFMVMALLMGLFASCNPQKKLAKAEATLSAAGVLPKICAERYPVKTEYIKGDSVLTLDTIYVGGIVYDTTTIETKDTVYKTITKILPEKVVTKLVRITDTLVKENTARVAEVTLVLVRKDAEIVSLKEKLSDMTEKRNKFRLWFWIMVGAIGAYTFLRIKKILPF